MAKDQQLYFPTSHDRHPPAAGQLLKWIGNKHRFARGIASHFPEHMKVYREPFLGSGAVPGTLAPDTAVASDSFMPLVEIWRLLHYDPETLKRCYEERWLMMTAGNKVEEYEKIKADYNARPNGADLLFLSRACYGGVVRFRQTDGYMSTLCGIHTPIPPASFAARVDEWHQITAGTVFLHEEYQTSMAKAARGDLIYCDPPYSFTQSILYGAQSFVLAHLLEAIRDCKKRGVFVALSIDGTKRSGDLICNIPIPPDLFEREILIKCGRSMLKRFQMNGKTLEGEVVHDRLLPTY